MNEFDRARNNRKHVRYVADENRARTEGDVKDPRICHDYGPRKAADPALCKRIAAAMVKMESVLEGQQR